MFDASVLEVFIASTADLGDEREAVEDVIREWNSRNAKRRSIVLKTLRWEKDATPQLDTEGGQHVINTQLLKGADILVGIFGKRLGSPTRTDVSGTVEEIRHFKEAKKPVLLYFSDRRSKLSNIDADELKRVNDFRKEMQQQGLYDTFSSISDLKQRVRDHLDSVLQDYKPLLIPAGNALAYTYFVNFLGTVHQLLTNNPINMPGYGLSLDFKQAKIRIAKPASLDEATDQAVSTLGKRCARIDLPQPAGRRPFTVYVRKSVGERLDGAKGRENQLTFDTLEVFDYPTPLLTLNKFVASMEQRLLAKDDVGLGYWQQQKDIQYKAFFSYMDQTREHEGLGRGDCTIEYFDFANKPDFELPP